MTDSVTVEPLVQEAGRQPRERQEWHAPVVRIHDFTLAQTGGSTTGDTGSTSS